MEFNFNIWLEDLLKKMRILDADSKKHFNFSQNVYDTMVRALMCFMLVAIDFVLFVGSGNFSLFDNGIYTFEVMFIIFIFALVCTVLFSIFAKFRIVQDILVAIAVYAFIYSLYNQFAQFDYHSFIADWFSLSGGFLSNHSEAFVALLFAVPTFLFYFKNKRHQILYLTGGVLVLFLGIMMHKFINRNPGNEFVVSYDNQIKKISADQDTGHKAVYLFLPRSSSYKTILKWKDLPQSQKTVDNILAFYAKNRFEIFPNAFIDENDQYLNFVKSLNSQRQGNVTDNLMKTKLLYKYWNFFNLIDEYIYLQRNDLIETYSNSGYKTSAYKSQVVDLCHKNHKFNVNRCVEKIGVPISIYGKNINSFEKIKIIIAEFLESTKLFGNLSGMYSMISIFSDIDKTPLVGINYSNLYVINSVYVFDKLIDDILNDRGDQAYFVYVDLPSDMYIYNEFCEIKPTSQWVNLTTLPWIKKQNDTLKKKAYLEQTMCLYGKLEEFMQTLRDNNLIDNTSIVIQGTSSFYKYDHNAPYVENFIKSQLVNMAYKGEYPKYFKVSKNICHTSNIINSVLYGNKLCDDLDGINAHISIKRDIYNDLIQDNIEEEYLQNAVDSFDKWFAIWREKNPHTNIISEKIGKIR